MMKIKVALWAVVLGAGWSVSSCNVSKRTIPTSRLEVPSSFNESEDSTSIASLGWRDFFDDPDLEELIDTALARNPDILIAMQRIETARAQTIAAKGALLPRVNAEIGTGGTKFGDYTMDGVGNYDTNFSPNINEDQKIPTGFLPNHFVGLRSSWEVDLWGKLRSQREAAGYRLLASESGRQLVITGLIAEIAREYYSLLTLDSELGILRYNIEIQTRANETISALKESGRANELAVRQFASQLLNSKAKEVQVQQEILNTELRINALLGRFNQPIKRGVPIRLQSMPEVIKAGVPAQLVQRRPDIRQAQYQILAAHSDLKTADLSFLPSLNLTADAGINAFKAGLLFNKGSLAYSLLGGLTAPVFNRKELKANQLTKLAATRESLQEYNKLVLSSFSEVLSNLTYLDNLEKIVAMKQEEADNLREAVFASQELFVAGYASYLEVLTTQKTVMEAELDYTRLKRDQFLTLLGLYRSLGGGWQ